MAPVFLRNLLPHREQERRANLLTVLGDLTWIQWAQLFVGWLAWTSNAIDFFTVSLNIEQLQRQFRRSTHDITTAITLTLLFRSLGAVVFGILSDRYGRKWPLVCNLLLISALELGVGFVQTFKQFLVLRSLFGVGMGGTWGLAVSTALENLPIEARGMASGVLQQGYSCGYLIAALISLLIVPGDQQGWRIMCWSACGISCITACLRALLPESECVLRAKDLERYLGPDSSNKTKVFINDMKCMLKKHWALCIYAVLLMAGLNFLSHGSQDLYPTFLEITKGFTAHQAIIATIFGSLVGTLSIILYGLYLGGRHVAMPLVQGSISGGITAGILSQRIGRRLTMILMVLLAGVFIPLWILPNKFGLLAAGAFCLQFGVQGAWGVIPIQLAEMSPPAFRVTFSGVVYQLGNMISAASAQIETVGGQHLRTTIIRDGQPSNVPDYAKVQGIFIGVVAVFVVIITVAGPEKHGSSFERRRSGCEKGRLSHQPSRLSKHEIGLNLDLDPDLDKESVKERVVHIE